MSRFGPARPDELFTDVDAQAVFGQLLRNPRELIINGYEPLTKEHLDGYIAAMNKHGFALKSLRSMLIIETRFAGSLLLHLEQFTGLEELALISNKVDGPLNLSNVSARKVTLIRNKIEVPSLADPRLILSPSIKRVVLDGPFPEKEIARLKIEYPQLSIGSRPSP